MSLLGDQQLGVLLAKKLDAEQKMTQWQPITTAPKDGTWILVFDQSSDHTVNLATWLALDDGSWVEPYEQWTTFKPTHWQPLPDAPK